MLAPGKFIGDEVVFEYISMKNKREKALQNIKRQSSLKTQKQKKANGSNNKPTKLYYFEPKRVAKMFQTIPAIVELPEKTDIILFNSFCRVTGSTESLVKVESVILPSRVIEIKEGAFRQLIISKLTFH